MHAISRVYYHVCTVPSSVLEMLLCSITQGDVVVAAAFPAHLENEWVSGVFSEVQYSCGVLI